MNSTTRTIKHRSFSLAVFRPLLVANLLANAITLLADLVASVIAGNVIGEEAISAVSLTSALYIVICFFGYIVSVGAPVLYNQLYGEFKLDESYKLFGQSLIEAVAIGIFASVFLKFFSPIYYGFYGASKEITAMAQDYFKYFVIVALIYPLYVLILNMVYQDGDAKLCILATVVQIVTNIIVAIILTSRIGIIGLGIGTVSGVVASALTLVLHFFKKTNSLHVKFGWDWKKLWLSIKLGLYSSVAYILCIVVSITINKYIITNFGEMYLPVYTALGALVSLSMLFASFTTASTPLISVYFGESNFYGIKRMMKVVFKNALVGGVIFVVLFEIFAPVVPKIFGLETEELLKSATVIVRGGCLAFLAQSMVLTLEGYYAVMRKSALSLCSSIGSSTVFPTLMMLLGMKIFGINGLGIGYFLSAVTSLLFVTLLVRIVYGKHAFPYIVPKSDSKTFMYDTYMDVDSFIPVRNAIGKDLRENGISDDDANRIELLIEESFIRIREENEGAKVLAEVSIMLGEKVQIIIKDNGKLFNLSEVDKDENSINKYVLANALARLDNKIYAITSGYNRNSFEYKSQN